MKELVLFTARDCAPCRSFKKMLKKAMLPFCLVDVDKEPKLADKLKIDSVPQLAVYDGKRYCLIDTSITAARKALKE